jgi:hypothetical protein
VKPRAVKCSWVTIFRTRQNSIIKTIIKLESRTIIKRSFFENVKTIKKGNRLSLKIIDIFYNKGKITQPTLHNTIYILVNT